MPVHTAAIRAAVLTVSLSLSATAHAALIGRLADGEGRYQAVYDSDLDITWLADAHYAATSGYAVDGQMSWDAALHWVAALNTDHHLGAADWRLPMSDDCSGYNCSGSELGHLFYSELDGDAGYGVPTTALADADIALFSGLQNGRYWSGSAYRSDAVWGFEFGPYDVGRQMYFPPDTTLYAWAVRDGDIEAAFDMTVSALAVPLPGALGLFGAGLIGMVGIARRRSNR